MQKKEYQKVLLFMGVLTSISFPSKLKEKLEEKFGNIEVITPSIPFTFTDYYNSEMGDEINRFFISFKDLIDEDRLAEVKTITNEIEKEFADELGNRKINLDPGSISESSVILATTKKRAHRIPIGLSLYAEVTLIYHKKGWESFNWTYSDYKSEQVQNNLTKLRKIYLDKLKEIK